MDLSEDFGREVLGIAVIRKRYGVIWFVALSPECKIHLKSYISHDALFLFSARASGYSGWRKTGMFWYFGTEDLANKRAAWMRKDSYLCQRVYTVLYKLMYYEKWSSLKDDDLRKICWFFTFTVGVILTRATFTILADLIISEEISSYFQSGSTPQS